MYLELRLEGAVAVCELCELVDGGAVPLVHLREARGVRLRAERVCEPRPRERGCGDRERVAMCYPGGGCERGELAPRQAGEGGREPGAGRHDEEVARRVDREDAEQHGEHDGEREARGLAVERMPGDRRRGLSAEPADLAGGYEVENWEHAGQRGG